MRDFRQITVWKDDSGGATDRRKCCNVTVHPMFLKWAVTGCWTVSVFAGRCCRCWGDHASEEHWKEDTTRWRVSARDEEGLIGIPMTGPYTTWPTEQFCCFPFSLHSTQQSNVIREVLQCIRYYPTVSGLYFEQQYMGQTPTLLQPNILSVCHW